MRDSKIEAQRLAVALFDQHARKTGLDQRARAELRGKTLACWCKPGEPCHADVLLEMANGREP